VTIVPLTAEHWPDVERIYAAGIATGQATFESEPPTWEAFDAGRLPGQRLVALDGGRVVGWVAASAVSERCAYAGVVEHSVYVDPAAAGRGVGRALLGRSSRGSSRRTRRASRCTVRRGSASSAPV